MNRNLPPRPLRWYAAFIGIFFVVLIVSIPLVIKGANVREDAGRFKLLPGDMIKTKCTLLDSRVVECNKPGVGWVVVYKRAEDNGGSVVRHPYSFVHEQTVAQHQVDDYPLNATYDCMCHPNVATGFPNVDCDLTQSPCLLDVEMARALIDMGVPYGYAGATLLAIGSLLMILSVLGMILLCISQGCCACCCGSDKNEILAQKIEIEIA